MTFLDRVHLPFGFVFLAILVFGALSIGLEAWLKLRMPEGWGDRAQRDLVEGIATLLVILYVVGHMRIIKGAAVRALAQLRPSVRIDDQAYERLAAKMIRSRTGAELGLLLAAVVLVVAFFVLPPDVVRRLPHQTIAELVAVAAILVFNVVAFVSVLNLVYVGVRNGVALGELARQPLVVNVFDPVGLLPFGRLSLVQSLAFVGVFLIPLVVIGPPQQGGWIVIGLSVTSLSVLFLPLWGVHQQIARARDAVLASICDDLLRVQDLLMPGPPSGPDALKALNERTEALMTLRKHVLSGPSWPFRDMGAVIRAVVAAASPIIYVVLNQLIQTYIFPLFAP